MRGLGVVVFLLIEHAGNPPAKRAALYARPLRRANYLRLNFCERGLPRAASISLIARIGMQRLLVCALALGALSSSAAAEPCPGNPDALGTARVLTVDPAGTPRVGRKQFPATLPLQAKELVLTFDDGPWPATTPGDLAGAQARMRARHLLPARPQRRRRTRRLVRREAAEGHSVGHHSYSHPLLNRMPLARAEAEIDRGIAAVEIALVRRARRKPVSAVLPLPRLCLQPGAARAMQKRAASWCSAPMSGPATGCR